MTILFKSPDVEVYDYVRAEIGRRMVDRMFDLTRPLKTVAEIGCNRGFITNHELPDGIEQIYLCDSGKTMLQQANDRVKHGNYKVSLKHLDEEMPKVLINAIFARIKLKLTRRQFPSISF